MPNNCIICGEELLKVECSGTVKDMKISFCNMHADFCDNCETITCSIVR